MLACAADGLPPTCDLVDIDDVDSATVAIGLEKPIAVSIVRVADGKAVAVREAILTALATPAMTAPAERQVIALVVGARGARMMEQLVRTGADGCAIVTSLSLSRAGLADPVDPDLVVREHSRATAGGGLIVLLELVKSYSGD